MCPSCVVAVAMYMSAPVSGDQDTVLTPHNVETDTFVGGQGPGDTREKKCRKIKVYSLSHFLEVNPKYCMGRIFYILIGLKVCFLDFKSYSCLYLPSTHKEYWESQHMSQHMVSL